MDNNTKNLFNGCVDLLIMDGTDKCWTTKIDTAQKSTITFGRAPDNNIVFSAAAVSSHHGLIELTNKYCRLYDLGSTNGTWINGKYIKDTLFNLSYGDIIRIDSRNDRNRHGAMIAISESGGRWAHINLSSKEKTAIGRDSRCDVVLSHIGVSKIHAIIKKLPDGKYSIENFGTNGTYVDNKIVSRPVCLSDRSMISITNTTFFICGDTLFYSVAEKGLSLESRHLTRNVKNGKTKKCILSDVNISINPGEFVAIVGGSGCGKSTLLNALTGYERATEGEVMVGDKSLYQNFDYFKSLMGFVPQQDIVYDHLPLSTMLDYTAQLRMPKDTTPEERKKRISEVLDMVELAEYKDSMVKKLSGGQRKRASIAVELLADPGLFFLDEPTSGLDPGTERNLMYTLRRLSNIKHKTVIMVTHTTLNLNLCDKIIFMGKGGKLCFCGQPDEALKFFGVDNFVDIYNLVSENSEKWSSLFASKAKALVTRSEGKQETGKKSRISFLRQTGILTKRYLNLIINDKGRLALLLAEPIIMGIILNICKTENLYENFNETRNLLFTLVCCCIWIGIFNSIQEICKERVILKREYMADLRLSAYISSKFMAQSILSILQSVLLILVFGLLIGLPSEGILNDSPVIEMFFTTFLTILSSSCMGLAVSAVSKNPDRAMTLSPFLLVIQLVFAGIIFPLKGASEIISDFTISRWSIGAYGVICNLESIYKEIPGYSDSSIDMYEYTIDNLLSCWGVLVLFVVVFCVVSAIALRNISKDSR